MRILIAKLKHYKYIMCDKETTCVLKLSDIIKNQAIINIGTAGHVAQGKSTVVKRITGIATQTYKSERERNITIRLGYANCKLFRNPISNKVFALPEQTQKAYDPVTNDVLELLYQLSFVDCPGHQAYIATMISGSSIMDHVLVVVAADEPIPQSQTHEHLIALEYSGIEKANICYLLNKLDLINPMKVNIINSNLNSYLDQNFGVDKERKIIPISAATGDNIDAVVSHLAEQVQIRMNKTIEQAQQALEMYIVRSYNINRPNTPLDKLEGAVVGGTIRSGVIAIGDLVEIRPGVINIIDGKRVIQPLVSRVIALKSGKNDVKTAIPGGLIGVNLSLSAGLSSDDKLKGQVLTHFGKGDPIYNIISGKFRGASTLSPKASTKLNELKVGSILTVIINGIMNVKAKVTALKSKLSKKDGEVKGSISLELDKPIVMNIEKSKNCAAIEINGQLIAGLQVTSASCNMQINTTHPQTYIDWTPSNYKIINDLHDYHANETQSFEHLVGNISHIGKAVRVNVVKPIINIVNLTTYLLGIDKFVASMTPSVKVPNALDLNKIIIANLEVEFTNSKPRYNGEGVLVMSGRWNQKQFDNFISTFIASILRCPSCRSEVSVIAKDPKTKLISRHCTICNSVTYLNKLIMK